MARTCFTFTNQWKNVWFGIAVNDVILRYIIYVTLRRFVFIWLFLGLVSIQSYGEISPKVLGRSNHDQKTKNRFQIPSDESNTEL